MELELAGSQSAETPSAELLALLVAPRHLAREAKANRKATKTGALPAFDLGSLERRLQD